MAGSISTLGVGSGLQLQDILDKLRAVDQQVVDKKKTSITKQQAQLNELTTVKNKLLTMKSSALTLSLSSTFLGRTVSSSAEGVVSATVNDGATVKSSALNVTHLAQKSSWMSTSGVAGTDSIVYVPTSQVSSGVTNPATDPIAGGAGQLTITFGGSSTITVDVDGATMLDDGGVSGLSLVSLINNDAENAGKVTASTYASGGQTYLRIETATPGGSGEANRVAITTNGTNLTFTPPNKVLTIQSGSEATSLSVAAETTLSQLMAQINDATDNPGITAAIVNDGLDPAKPYKLALTANDYGEDQRISFLSQLPDLAMAEQADQVAANSLNAQFTVDNISYQRQSNTVTDILTGVTLTLQGTGTSTVNVGSNTSDLKDSITAFVTAYNDVVQEIKGESAYDPTSQTFGVLANTTTRGLPSELQGLMTATNQADSSGHITSMFNLGMEFQRDGTISIDEEILDAALADHADGIQAFFLGDSDAGITGFADTVNNRLRTMTSDSGSVAADKSAAQTRIDDLTLHLTEETARLDRKYEQLTKQFVALDSYMNQMASMSNFLTGQFNSLADGWVNSSSNDK